MLKILHTGDWHLGKKLNNISRIAEQKTVIDEFVALAQKNIYDVIIIAGDIFDTYNPSGEAQKIYYDCLNKLKVLDCIVVIICGNHDSELRISACQNLVLDDGIFIFSNPNSKFEKIKNDKFEVLDSDNGCMKILFKNKFISINTLSYPNEVNLNTNFSEIDNYSKFICEQFNSCKYDKKFYNIIVSHLFVSGAPKDGDERQIELGGSLCVNVNDFPKSDYIALGHIHKPIIFKKFNAAYSGSILEYRNTESGYEKCFLDVELSNNEAKIEKILITNIKPLKTYNFNLISDAINFVEKHEKNELIYINIEEQYSITSTQLKQLYSNKNVVEVIIAQGQYSQNVIAKENHLDINEVFLQAYEDINGEIAEDEVVDIFTKLLNEVENETS